MHPTPHQTPTPSQAAALAHYGPMAGEAAQPAAPPPVQDSLTVAQVIAFAESRLAQQRTLAASMVAKAEAQAGTAACSQHAVAVDLIRHEAAECYVLAELCATLSDYVASERIAIATKATVQALIDQAYRCRMLGVQGWAPGRLDVQQPAADAVGGAA